MQLILTEVHQLFRADLQRQRFTNQQSPLLSPSAQPLTTSPKISHHVAENQWFATTRWINAHLKIHVNTPHPPQLRRILFL